MNKLITNYFSPESDESSDSIILSDESSSNYYSLSPHSDSESKSESESKFELESKSSSKSDIDVSKSEIDVDDYDDSGPVLIFNSDTEQFEVITLKQFNILFNIKFNK